ncbi:MAG: hypothetical protein M0R06_05350 [Sphaerochaeta sp.]|jgi:hypothetical protein|nr:hypothetical protein [Sphaerochaeta sp.]
MENKGEIITKPSSKMPHRDEEHKFGRKRKDIIAACVSYWILVVMFGSGLLVEVYGAVTGRLDFSGIMLVVSLIPTIIFMVLGILETRKLKR